MIKNYKTSIYQEMQRVKKHGPRKPLRTLSELAATHNMAYQRLGRILQEPGAPKPIVDNRQRGVAQRTAWYSPIEVQRWLEQRGAK